MRNWQQNITCMQRVHEFSTNQIRGKWPLGDYQNAIRRLQHTTGSIVVMVGEGVVGEVM